MDGAGELFSGGPVLGGNDLGRLLCGGWTAVPCAWASEGSGGAATRWFWRGMGFLLSRLTGLAGSCWPGSWEPGDGLTGLFVEGLFPILWCKAVSSCFGSGNSSLETNNEIAE